MSYKLVSELSEKEMKNFSESFDTVIAFCEVVSGKGGEIADRGNAIEILKKFGKRLVYFSRDCSMSRREICEDLRKANYELKSNEIVCMTSLIAKYLKKRLIDKKIYVIGSSGISEELDDVGLPNFGTGPDILTTDLATFVHSYKDDPEIGAVVVGYDEHFNYPKMLRAASYLSVTDVIHVACTVRTKVTAALVACIETCSEKKAIIFDTSASLISNTLIDDYQIIPENTLIIAPTENGDICLARFRRLHDFLSVTPFNESSSFRSPDKLDELSIESILYANDLAELASCLNI